MDQLSELVGEECVLLTASAEDCSYSHLASSLAEPFLADNSHVESEFLDYCMQGGFFLV